MTISDKLLELSEYEKLLRTSRLEDINKTGAIYQYLEFNGDAETIHKNSYKAVANGLPITGDTFYILFFCNSDTPLDTINRLGISSITEAVKQKIEFGIFFLREGNIKKPLKLLFVYE